MGGTGDYTRLAGGPLCEPYVNPEWSRVDLILTVVGYDT